MLTIFATPKAFQGHFDVIQRNAIKSWTKLTPAPQVILFGDSQGTRQVAAELGVAHVPAVEANEFGTPYLRALFDCAEKMSPNHLLCYVNADIILTEGFEQAVAAVRHTGHPFLMVGARMNLDVTEPLAFDPDWRGTLKQMYQQHGAIGDNTSIDFFLFTKGLYRDIPPLAVGRAWFDQWLIKAAASRGWVIDSSPMIPIVHQNHGYAHVEGGRTTVYKGVEAERNLAIYGGQPHAYTLLNCTHALARDGHLRRVWFRKERFQLRQAAWDLLIRRTGPLRAALGLRRKRAR
jgi:hypothetical protein